MNPFQHSIAHKPSPFCSLVILDDMDCERCAELKETERTSHRRIRVQPFNTCRGSGKFEGLELLGLRKDVEFLFRS